MGARYTLTSPADQLRTLFDRLEITTGCDLEPKFNIAPTHRLLAVRRKASSTTHELVPLRWGLIPSWTENPNAVQLIKARCETVAEKPSFREAFRKRRCLIPADGFYEWKQEDGRGRPYWIHRPDEEPFTFAGLWESWKDDNDRIVESCTIVSTVANQLIAPIHHRMPVIVPPEWRDGWLDLNNGVEEFRELFLPAPEDGLRLRRVSNWVNSVQVDSPKCIEPLQVPQERQLLLWAE
jgi:putative SOS response-associated peptidase YedK